MIEELLDFLERARGSRNNFEDDDFADHMEAASVSCATEDDRRLVALRNRSETPNDIEFLLEWMDDGRGTSTWKFDMGRVVAEVILGLVAFEQLKYIRRGSVAGEAGFRGLGLTAGTTASSWGTTEVPANRSNKLCRRRRYSSSLSEGSETLKTRRE
jgi:hypothetical protein